MDEGAEAYVFTSDAVPGVVYKIFPRTPAGGYGLVDQLSTDETDRITNEVRDASSLEPLINKLLVIDELGVPSEILGMGDDGSVVVKQSDARDRDVAGGNKFFHASGDVMAMSNSALTESGFGITSGDIFLVTDLHKFNHVRGVVLDAVVTRMPDILTKRGPFKRFFDAMLNECR
jgi:hypothetical protein